MREIGGDKASAEWESDRPASRGKTKAPWLAETLAKLDREKRKRTSTTKEATAVGEKKTKKLKR
jgi:hypothetical protein